MPAKPLGAYLLDAGVITKDQLDTALRESRASGELLGEVLIRMGFAAADDLSKALADQAGIPRIDVSQHRPDPDLCALIPEPFARKHKVIAISKDGFTLTVAMANIFDVTAIDDLQRRTKLFIKVMWAKEGEIQRVLDLAYSGQGGRRAATEEEAQQAETRAGVAEASVGVETPVTKLVEELFQKASKEGATDIHINPDEKTLRTRFRFDGILYAGATMPKELHPSIITRIKILAGLNISENRLPQDGRVLYHDGPYRLDLRVSTFPTIHGENVVIRVLDKSRSFGLEQLGFTADKLLIFKRLIEKPYGLILVTGPTGSGKTTTLYSALTHINSQEVNIVTLEDPVEYELPLIRQCQINPRAGLTFVTGLRAILRHDPDIILVGEMRDLETVETTVRAALTGHLVFSTFHTNDAVGTIPRLLEMGVEPFLVASSLLAVVGQRLVRVICKNCKTEVTLDDEILARVGSKAREVETFYKGKGCAACNQTGYRGRLGIFELLEVTPRISQLIAQKAEPAALYKAALDEGMETMFQDGLKKVAAGITTVEELIRVTYSVE
ncbi:MAG: Flp pilus assembly complex ATPase component TadA [Candidatus Rokubacteria bacterium]|nr:Flp pilus assembly complex ATPase component TadA [Candidatus Rokubacteria bacterium]